MIVLKSIKKVFNKGKSNELVALKDISINIENGDMTAIMGRSGAGKSTLLHIIGCLDTPTQGEFILDDINITSLNNNQISKIRNEKIGILMQDFALISGENALENVMTPLYFSKTPLKIMKKIAINALKKVGVEDLAKQKVNTMSGGQKQRVALARALVNSPKIILADEPTGALDKKTSEEIIGLLKSFNTEGVTIIIITHDINVANQCSKIIKIEDGTILE